MFVDGLGFHGIQPDRFDANATFLVAKDPSEQIVGALRLIFDSEQGLPVDDYADLTGIRSAATRLAEASRLACDHGHRGNLIALHGVGFLKTMAIELGASHLVIDSLLDLVPFYSRMGFVRMGEPIVDRTVCRPDELPNSPNAQVMWAALAALRGW